MTDGRIPMRTRFAPSPTGPLHFGSVRTALFAWLAARSSGGSCILRIEDTDQERYLEDSEALIMETLLWLGLTWDEGPEVGGPHGPYIQSQRTDVYRQHADVLMERGAAYWCTCSPERLAEMREQQRAARRPTRYDRRCLGRQDEVREERAAGMAAVLRQLIAPGRTTWDDVVRGEISFDNADIDDQVLLKSDGFPTYHLAVVVDDHLMEITHVIRSDEWIPSTPKHLGLYDAFEWTPPRFAHVPPVLGEDRQKLSKRRGARNVLEYGELGYLAPAVVNAMALLGWSSGTEEEVFTPADLVERFSLERVNDSAAVFDPKRLDSLNGQHIRRLPVEELVELLEFWLPGTSKETRRKLVPLLQERMVTMRDATELAAPLLGDAPWDDDVVFPPRKVDKDTAIALLDAGCAEVERGALEDVTAMRERLTAMLEERGVKARDGFRVLYIAILGRAQGVPVFDAMAFIGSEVSVQRLRAARARLEL
ncbi:MAG: glutamate--tRNA ligase [Candidatus Aeolococcus gillhamiae]|uniref:Glutamate--tRNA ligase n=2 Tax=Candidatus Aeolococcus gillhamiae TaxID=3127015 RepID=A0A2W5Z8V8_9BACT|nr:MAG: glutamate--tRNA ligase [Candidatus Dormibacter sp. RRmetagenome_bin12]